MHAEKLERIRDTYFEYFTWLSDSDVEYLVSMPGYDLQKRRCGRCNNTGYHIFVDSYGRNSATKCDCVQMLVKPRDTASFQKNMRKNTGRKFASKNYSSKFRSEDTEVPDVQEWQP